MEVQPISIGKNFNDEGVKNEVGDDLIHDENPDYLVVYFGKTLTMELRNEVWEYLIHDGNPDYLVFYFGNRVLKLPLKKMKAEARIFRNGYILGREDEEKGERIMTFQTYQRKRGIDISTDEQQCMRPQLDRAHITP